LRAGRNGSTAKPLARRIVHVRPRATLRNLGQRELDGVWRSVDDNKDSRLPALDGGQRVRQEVPVRKTPILFRHLNRLGREPQGIVRAIGPSTLEPPVTLKLREAPAQLHKLANERAHVLAVAAEA